MRVGFPGGPRLEWYDRNPQVKAGDYVLTGAPPHGETVRLSYTVPTGKKCLGEIFQQIVMRETAATTALRVIGSLTLTPSGAAAEDIQRALIFTNNVGDKDISNVAGVVVLLDGDQIELTTQDASTGGTCTYFLSYKVTEFDA